MTNKKRSKNVKTSLNRLGNTHQLPINVNKALLDQCSDVIQNFIDSDDFVPKKITISKSKKRKRQISKIKKPKSKVIKIKKAKSNRRSIKKNAQSSNYIPIPITNGYPCFRSCGPINCPKNKLPMPRDLWYRIVYSQVLEQQLGSGETFLPERQSVSHLPSLSKRKYHEDESQTSYKHLPKNQSNTNHSRRQQTSNAAFSTTSNKTIPLEINDDLHKAEWNEETLKSVPLNMDKSFASENLPLDQNNQLKGVVHPENESKRTPEPILWHSDSNRAVLLTQSAHAELINRREGVRTISNTPSAPIIRTNFPDIINSEQSIEKATGDTSLNEHPLIDQLIEHYKLQDIPRMELFKRFNRRLIHIHQTLETMSINDMEIKLKYKRDALVKKQLTPVQSLTKDERIAMAELELNVYEYVKALDASSSEYIPVNNHYESKLDEMPLMAPTLLSDDEVLLTMKSTLACQSSISTLNTAMNQSITLLPTIITQFNNKTEKFISWDHSRLPNLLNMFEPLTPSRKARIHKQLARRYDHICKKAKELDRTQLQTQINSKSKMLEQYKNLRQPNEDERLRIAELELSLYELEKEQTQRNQYDEMN